MTRREWFKTWWGTFSKVLTGLLGMSAEQIAALRAKAIL